MSGLQARLDEFKKTFESGGPPYNAPHEAIEKMHRATEELKASGIEDHALKAGDRAPSFTLLRSVLSRPRLYGNCECYMFDLRLRNPAASNNGNFPGL
jgi:hypothetical protein